MNWLKSQMLSGSVVIWDIDSVSEVCDITDILHLTVVKVKIYLK